MTSEVDRKTSKPAARHAKTKARWGGGNDAEFINRELSAEEIVDLRNWREDVDNVWVEITEALEGGYRLSVKFDDYSSSIAAFFIPGEDSDNYGFILSGRGGNAYRAIAQLIYKHVQIFGKVWVADGARRNRDDDPEF